MKTCFRSAEIAHVWANQGAPHGRSPGNLSFSGDALSSYSTVIARRLTFKGKTAYVLDRASFSVSTSKSQGRAWQAIPDNAKSFHIRAGSYGQRLDFTPQTLRDHYEKAAADAAAGMPSRYAFKRAEQFNRVTNYLREAVGVCEFFGLPHKGLDSKIAARSVSDAQAAELMKTVKAAMVKATAARDARQLRERTAANVAAAEKFIAGGVADSFRDNGPESALATLPDALRVRYLAAIAASNAALADRWRNGEDVRGYNGDLPVMLRREGDGLPGESAEMVTSRGARVPLADAERAYRFAQAVRNRAEGWHKNGETCPVGMYQLDAVNASGIVAGCHRVSWEEVDRFAVSQGWAKGGAL